MVGIEICIRNKFGWQNTILRTLAFKSCDETNNKQKLKRGQILKNPLIKASEEILRKISAMALDKNALSCDYNAMRVGITTSLTYLTVLGAFQGTYHLITYLTYPTIN